MSRLSNGLFEVSFMRNGFVRRGLLLIEDFRTLLGRWKGNFTLYDYYDKDRYGTGSYWTEYMRMWGWYLEDVERKVMIIGKKLDNKLIPNCV